MPQEFCTFAFLKNTSWTEAWHARLESDFFPGLMEAKSPSRYVVLNPIRQELWEFEKQQKKRKVAWG